MTNRSLNQSLKQFNDFIEMESLYSNKKKKKKKKHFTNLSALAITDISGERALQYSISMQ